MAKPRHIPRIYVLAGTNGAGKSSIIGATFLEQGIEYFNPDIAAPRILSANPGISQAEANSAAWHEGKRLLERAIVEKLNFAFETTLGGKTIVALLAKALSVRYGSADLVCWPQQRRAPYQPCTVQSRTGRTRHTRRDDSATIHSKPAQSDSTSSEIDRASAL